MAKPFCLDQLPKTTVIIVAGPTASGKSDWALRQALTDSLPQEVYSSMPQPENDPNLCIAGDLPFSDLSGFARPCAFKDSNMEKPAPGRIINADSMQIYKGLDILTAMPSAAEQSLIPHDLYGILPSYSDGYDVSQWTARVHESIAMAHSQNQRAWVVGGTGFYIKTLIHGLSPMPCLNGDDKAFLRHKYQLCSILDLKKWLEPVDPFSAHHFMDHQRLLHAWIVYRLTGHPLSWWHQQPRVPSTWSFFKVLLWPSREKILARAAHRWESMVAQGVYNQVQSFCSNPNWHQSPLRKAIGVAPIYAMLDGQISPEQCRHQYLIDVAQYVKRQRTWFRRQFHPHYVCDDENHALDPGHL